MDPIGVHQRPGTPMRAAQQPLGGDPVLFSMFGFLRRYSVRWIIGLAGALPALAGGILVLVATLSTAQTLSTLTLVSAFHAILGIGALFGASRIYRASKAILFAKARLTGAAILTAIVGVLLFLVGFGTEAILVLAGSVVAFIGAYF